MGAGVVILFLLILAGVGAFIYHKQGGQLPFLDKLGLGGAGGGGLARNASDRDKDNVPWDPNYCNDTNLQQDAALSKTALGQFLGYECDQVFYHCRLTIAGWKTYRKSCRVGLVFDTSGTQNCNYNFNVAGCGNKQCDCTSEQYACCLSEECIDLAGRCDGKYDCALEEDEQNCASCTVDEFPCTTTEQCVSLEKRCDGAKDCKDGTDEQFCQECGTGKFWCRKSQECLDKEYRCNGNKDCRFGEDELFCSNPVQKQYLCEDQKHSVTRDDVCNGIEDCPDGSDELYCSESPSMLINVIPQPKSIERENTITNNQKVRKSLAKDDGGKNEIPKSNTKINEPAILNAMEEKFLKAIIVDKNMPDYVNEEEKDSPIYLYLNRKVTDDDRSKDNFYSPVYNFNSEYKDPFEPKIDPQTKKYILEKLHILPDKGIDHDHFHDENVHHEEDEEEEAPYDKKKELWLKYGYFD